MRTIRDSIPMPTDETILQKIIPQGDIVKYLDGTYTDVRGYITKAPDVKQLITYDDIYRALGLNYDDSNKRNNSKCRYRRVLNEKK